jgi:hypothetical protein
MPEKTGFRELPPIEAPARPPRRIELDESGEPIRRRVARAAADGPRAVRAVVAGPRLTLIPGSHEAERDLAAARATAGSRYDHQAKVRTFHLDRALRHGGVRIEDALLAAELAGIGVELDTDTERLVARRRRAHERQSRPIPRAVWRDENETADAEIVADQALGGGSWRR